MLLADIGTHIAPHNKLPVFLLGVMFGSQALCNLGSAPTPGQVATWRLHLLDCRRRAPGIRGARHGLRGAVPLRL